MEISKVLSQLRSLAQGIERPGEQAGAGQVDFGSVLRESVATVNDQQREARALVAAFESGQPDVDLAEVMIATQKASVSFQAMTEVRNKLVEAYREIMNMPV